ncbi:MAG: hypothetical protein CM1200mP1_06220 [Candidatus Neomarinimicrobiota bacterium]|nr:MAG: hypothetical protein CM1200mP1_06220 [Candidatus Neomarinimicrobiota bacterium]
MGICNGAQILVESGFVPGLNNFKLGLALTDNKRIQGGQVVGVGYYNTWSNLKLAVEQRGVHLQGIFKRVNISTSL